MPNMADSTLTELQRVTVQMLDNWVMDPKILIQNCPLDHGRHEIKPKHDLGGLHVLPTELQQHVLCFVDIKTLLTFRSVSMSAMGVVDGIIECQKVGSTYTVLEHRADDDKGHETRPKQPSHGHRYTNRTYVHHQTAVCEALLEDMQRAWLWPVRSLLKRLHSLASLFIRWRRLPISSGPHWRGPLSTLPDEAGSNCLPSQFLPHL